MSNFKLTRDPLGTSPQFSREPEIKKIGLIQNGNAIFIIPLKLPILIFCMRQFFFIVLVFCSFTMLRAQTIDLFDKLVHTSGKDSLPYRLLKPVNPQALERFPLIIFLHGSGERGTDNEAQIKHIKNLFLDTKNRGKYPAYVLAPQCPKGVMWAEHNKDGSMKSQPTQPTKLLLELIEKISKEFPIDKTRIYITGVSMGGYGTWDLLARYPEMFAAGVPVCGGGDANSAAKMKGVPIWAFHGALDDVVPARLSRKMIQAIQKAGGMPGYTEYPDIKHDSWVQAYQEPHLLPWLFKQNSQGNSD
jgi:predicted peptidase